MVMDVSERRVCRVAGQHRSTQRRPAPPNPYRDRLVGRMRELAVANPRRGRRYIIDLLRKGRWSVGARLMKRLWRREGLLVPGKRMKRRRIGTGENGIVRRRATRRNEVWGMDFVQDWTADGRPLRMLVVLDEYTRECLAIEVRRRLRGKDVVAVLDELNLTQNTIFIFMADNGMNLGQLALIGKGNASILGTKPPIHRPNMFDRSVIVPFIVRWPGVVKAGTTSDAFVSTIDILPTLMAVTGASAGQNLTLDGRSILPLLKGETAAWRNAYSDTYDMIYLDESHMRMLRTDRWKLVFHFDADGRPQAGVKRHELFDLKNDPEELTNLYGKQSVAETQQQLEAQLRAWIRKELLHDFQ